LSRRAASGIFRACPSGPVPPFHIADQIISIDAGSKGFLDNIPVPQVRQFETALLDRMSRPGSHPMPATSPTTFRRQAGHARPGSLLRIPLLAACAATVPAAAQDLVQNGSFEVGPNPGLFSLWCPSSTAVTGWTVTRDCIHYCSSALWQTVAGVRSIDLDGLQGDSGGVAQTLATTPGARYQVQFRLAGNPNSGPALKRLVVAAAGTQAEFTFNINGRSDAAMGWSDQRWTFTATGTTTTLEFYSITVPSGWGPVIDDVRVTPLCSADFDGDGDEGTDADIEAFFIVLAGGVCPTGDCDSTDFDGDGDEGTDADIEAFFRVIAGGPC